MTVLIAVFNGEKTIRRTLNLVSAQSFTDYEILVVDDGSRDGTRRILESLKDPTLRTLVNDLKLGLTLSLCRGVLEAKGKYIARIDDGYDRISPKWLEKCLVPLEQDDTAVLCGPRTRSWRGSCLEESSQPAHPDILRWILSLHNCVLHVGAVFRRVVGGQIQNYSANFSAAQDYELWSRLARVGRIHIVPEFLVEPVYMDDGITMKRRAEQELYAAKVRAAQQNWLLNRNDITPELANTAAALYWRWEGVSSRDTVRGSRLLRQLRRAYLERFGTPGLVEHLEKRFYGHARWLFHRAEEAAVRSRPDALRYMLAAWLMSPSQIFDQRTRQVMVRIVCH